VIGIDIGGTTTSFGFVDRYGVLICEATLDTQAHQPAHTLVARLCDAIEKLRTTLGLPQAQLPYLFSASFGATELEDLSRRLERAAVDAPPHWALPTAPLGSHPPEWSTANSRAAAGK
jgi:hypothetical protein